MITCSVMFCSSIQTSPLSLWRPQSHLNRLEALVALGRVADALPRLGGLVSSRSVTE